MSFFGRDHGQRIVQDEQGSYKDEHSAPFLYQTKSQLNLCVLSEYRYSRDVKPTSPPPVMSELAMSHSKVVSELKNALKSNPLKSYKDCQEKETTSPSGKFFNKFIGKFLSLCIQDGNDRLPKTITVVLDRFPFFLLTA